MNRTIDHEHNWFWQEGYRDAFNGGLPDVATSWHSYQRSDYFAGYKAGGEDREAHLEDDAGKRQECPHCNGTNTRRLSATHNGVFPEEHECFDCRGTW